MNKLFFLLSLIMGAVVLASNYLVQFPINYYGLEELLTYGAFSYPIAFLITDLANRSFGKIVARKIVYIGFTIGILFTLIFSTNFTDLISIRIAIGSGTAFIIAQLLDVQIFDQLRKKKMVHSSFNIVFNWLNSRYFFILLDIILWNRNTLDHSFIRRFNSQNFRCLSYAYTF